MFKIRKQCETYIYTHSHTPVVESKIMASFINRIICFTKVRAREKVKILMFNKSSASKERKITMNAYNID